MKKGYIKLLTFEIVIIAILLLNSFVLSILNRYIYILFLAIILVFFKIIFGFEKDRNRYWKSICLEVIIYLLIFFLAYYLLGLFTGFYKTINYFNFRSIRDILTPIVILIILKEILRYMMLKKSEGSKLSVIMTTILFIIFDITFFAGSQHFQNFYDFFVFVATILLPYISKNVIGSYISIHDGYKPTILFYLVMELYTYVIPIIPNPNHYIYSLIHLLVPFALLYRLYIFYKGDRDEKIESAKQSKEILGLIPCTIIIGILVYFTSGYFRYHAIVIGSGSMVPALYKGDVVLVEKKHNDIEKLEVGQVIAVNYENTIIVHRIAKKINVEGQTIIYTKGDANNNIDSYKVTKEMIYGLVNVRIPYIGFLPVWLRNL